MLITKIRKLTVDDIDETIALFAKTCRYDEYFRSMFGVKDCEQNIIKEFTPDVTAALKTGLCLGIFEKSVMIGCILSVDWFRYYEEEHALFKHMFKMDLDSTSNIINKAMEFKKLYFIFAVGVADGKRCQGCATKMLKHYLKLVPKDTAVMTDCLYDNAMSLWLKQSFIVTETGDLQLAVKV